jgi:hypothetical protein
MVYNHRDLPKYTCLIGVVEHMGFDVVLVVDFGVSAVVLVVPVGRMAAVVPDAKTARVVAEAQQLSQVELR